MKEGPAREAPRQEHQATLTMVEKFRGLRLQIMAIEGADFEAAAGHCDVSGAALRAGDALHLAIGRRLRGSHTSMDQGLAAAGQEVGPAVELIEA